MTTYPKEHQLSAAQQYPRTYAKHPNELEGKPVWQDKDANLPAGWVRQSEGFLYNEEEKILLDEKTGKRMVYDEEFDSYCELREGDNLEDVMSICAACSAAADATGKRVIIQDMHKASEALKKKFGHFDRPASLFVLFDGDAAIATQSAKAFYSKIFDKLAQHQGEWKDSQVLQALSVVIAELEATSTAVLLILGKRLFAAASGLARCIVNADAQPDFVVGQGAESAVATGSFLLTEELSYAMLIGGAVPSSALSNEEAVSIVGPHPLNGRPYSGAAAVVRVARQKNLANALAFVTTVRIKKPKVVLPPASSIDHVAKKPRMDAGAEVKSVRIRHILVRHAGAKVAPVDPVRKKNVTRSLEEAEAALLEALAEVGAAVPATSMSREGKLWQGKFTIWVKACSECESAMKGGDFSGDLGWINPSERAQNQPEPLVKAAFALQVGQVSDIITTDQGVHLLMRSA